MPASLYRMVGRPHYTEVINKEPELPQVPAPPEEISTPQVESPSVLEAFADQLENPTMSSTVLEGSEASGQEDLNQDVPEVKASPTWEASWSKAQLLVVAKELGLNVSNLNTKNEILAALAGSS